MSNCWLKSTVTPAVEAAEFTAGVRSGMIVGSFYTGTRAPNRRGRRRAWSSCSDGTEASPP